jgi:molecular chaperone GrpE (heat shock protein)
MSKLIKEAERNVINQAKYYTDLIGVLDDLQHGVLRTLDSHSPGREKITEGFNQVRQGV